MDEKTREAEASASRRLMLLVDYANKLAALDMAEGKVLRCAQDDKAAEGGGAAWHGSRGF